VASAVGGKCDPTWKPMIVPPATITSAGEEIEVESISEESILGWMSQVKKIAGDSVLWAPSASRLAPSSQFENLLAELSVVPVWCSEGDAWRRHNNHETVCAVRRIEGSTLFP
jgi:hypothetical protein